MSLLFGDEWGNVRLETSCAKTHDNDGEGKSSKRPIGMRDNRWNGRNDKNDVADEGNSHRDGDSFESSPFFVRKVGTQKGSNVTPSTQLKRILVHLRDTYGPSTITRMS